MPENAKPIAFEVVDRTTREVVHVVEITGEKSERTIDKVESGLFNRTDFDRFFVRRVYAKRKG